MEGWRYEYTDIARSFDMSKDTAGPSSRILRLEGGASKLSDWTVYSGAPSYEGVIEGMGNKGTAL
jgi:hypothetical protein